eukprot:CAMPEP_0205950800 /NCGR_PEP_ID=MMETSP1459-20131121/2566_1 /ASSEMBLY_ACC=CAM_ASM_001120 /TAXON_ID=41880 /ORGANISM="Pycnococcus provasolii, Strain RCC931" /LENGTH=283 /DNA_ID=CAMNT_0053322483 /DNA_START=106 /DNA_END=955 /DNA_ORIENTATION=-
MSTTAASASLSRALRQMYLRDSSASASASAHVWRSSLSGSSSSSHVPLSVSVFQGLLPGSSSGFSSSRAASASASSGNDKGDDDSTTGRKKEEGSPPSEQPASVGSPKPPPGSPRERKPLVGVGFQAMPPPPPSSPTRERSPSRTANQKRSSRGGEKPQKPSEKTSTSTVMSAPIDPSTMMEGREEEGRESRRREDKGSQPGQGREGAAAADTDTETVTETAQGEGRRCKGSSNQEEGCSKNEAREALETEQTQDTQLPCSWATCRCKGRARTGSSVDNAASR